MQKHNNSVFFELFPDNMWIPVSAVSALMDWTCSFCYLLLWQIQFSKWFGDNGAVFDLKSFMKDKVNTNDLDKKKASC